jgi:hypothetical protein
MMDVSPEDPSITKLHSNESSGPSPLEMDCDHAISFIENHVEKQNIHGIDLSNWSALSNSEFLDKVSEMMLVPALTECVGTAFYPLLPALVGRWATIGEESIESIACAMGRLIYLEPRLKRYNLS